ncbi:hypothetical protein [Flavobacterium aquiphilum]|uniref:hypothetical protein n=1 Tax=Flavobacterium aquiphilum TaxID=3003261 RepID=UPI00247FA2E0|nr:hypothetical protein [Flavobacterium aquiphilum]
MAKKTKPVSAAQAEALQKALEEAELKIKALNTLIDVAEEQLKIDIKKSLVPSRIVKSENITQKLGQNQVVPLYSV